MFTVLPCVPIPYPAPPIHYDLTPAGESLVIASMCDLINTDEYTLEWR